MEALMKNFNPLFTSIKELMTSKRWNSPFYRRQCLNDIADLLFQIAEIYYSSKSSKYDIDTDELCSKAVEKAYRYIEAGEYNSDNLPVNFTQILKSGYIDDYRTAKRRAEKAPTVSYSKNKQEDPLAEATAESIPDPAEDCFEALCEKEKREYLHFLIEEFARYMKEDYDFVYDLLCPDDTSKQIAKKYSGAGIVYTESRINNLKNKYYKAFIKWLEQHREYCNNLYSLWYN